MGFTVYARRPSYEPRFFLHVGPYEHPDDAIREAQFCIRAAHDPQDIIVQVRQDNGTVVWDSRKRRRK